MRHQLSAGLLAACVLASTNAQSSTSNPTYTLTTNYAGSAFFSNFVYNVSVIDNTTQGNIHYVGPSSNLTYINAAGNAIIKVDNTTSGVGDSTFGRNSIKLVSNASYGLGTLYIVDAVHLPYGCSVWPAIWTLSSQLKTDDGGEVDIWEGVNNDQSAQYTMHTKTGCTQSNNTAMPFSAQVISTNCDYNVNGNQGCAFREKKAGSYGAAFASNGGGVFATVYDANGVQTWFFPRSSIPSDITSGSPNPSSWGTPSASWPSPSCDMSTYFTPQNIVINITLCGLWAGAAPIFAQTCSGQCTDYIANPANFDNAYFEIRSLKVYGGGRTTPTVTAATQVNSTIVNSNSNSNSISNKPNAAARKRAAKTLAVLAAGAAAVAMRV